MSTKIKQSFFVEWNRLFSKNVGRPFLLSFVLVPIITFIFVEMHSLQHLEQSAKGLESEVAQAIITGDSYLGTRMLKTTEIALQLSFAEVKTPSGVFATSGKIPPPATQIFLWKVLLPIKSQWGENIGTLIIVSNPFPIQRVLALLFMGFSSVVFFILNRLVKRFHTIANDQIAEIDGIVAALSSDTPKLVEEDLSGVNFKNETASKLAQALSNFILLKDRVFEQNLKIEKEASFSIISKQVAHDIRSPLTALNMVMGAAKELPEEKRVLIRNAVQRINDIANNLLVKSKTQTAGSTDCGANTASHKQTSHASNLKLDTHLLSSLIDTIVSEKRIQFRDKINVHIEADLNQAYGLFARIDSQEFQRVLSNLINNSVEALPDGKGEVKVSIRGYTNTILVVVFDNGMGIPEHILAKLGEIGVSYGKEGTESGSGLGVAHAKKAIESFGGKFEIQSRAGEGTMINITLTREPTPKWFVEEIRLNPNMQLVSVDDDVSIHQVWSGRFKSLHISEVIKHLSFTSTKSFIDWFGAQATDNNVGISDTLFLVDYEFLNEAMTGLDLIEKLNISKYAILITSRFEEPQIRARCDSAGLKLIPKSMAGLVPIKIEQPLIKEQKQLSNVILPDAILIDDDTLVHMTWNSFAKENNKKYALYFSVEEFLKEQNLYDHAVCVYVDSNLGNSVKGEDAAKEIFKQGFKNIFIATGYEASSIAAHPWIKGVVGKDPQ